MRNSIFNPGQKRLEPMTNIGSILGEYGDMCSY